MQPGCGKGSRQLGSFGDPSGLDLDELADDAPVAAAAIALDRSALNLKPEAAATLSDGRNAAVGDERAQRHCLTF